MTSKYGELVRSHKDWEMYIDGEFTSLGMPQDLLGYYYLIAGIILCAEDISLVKSLLIALLLLSWLIEFGGNFNISFKKEGSLKRTEKISFSPLAF